MHLRRALLLFAIVLGLAAVAASVSRPRNSTDKPDTFQAAPTDTTTDSTPTVKASPDGPPPAVELTFVASRPQAQRVQAGQAATVLVEVDEAGQVDIADLGMTDVAEPLTPARFEVLTSSTGRYPISFVPAGQEEQPLEAGTLVVAAPE